MIGQFQVHILRSLEGIDLTDKSGVKSVKLQVFEKFDRDTGEGISCEFAAVEKLTDGTRVRALVVDDIAENQEVLSLMLSLVGCEVQVARSGEEGLDLIRIAQPDIVFGYAPAWHERARSRAQDRSRMGSQD